MNTASALPGDQPTATIDLPDGRRITLLGTAHVSRVSTEAVEAALATGAYDAVAVELCPGRHQSLMDPASLERMDLFDVIRSGRASMVAASLALGAYQQRLAEQLGIEPGAEMKAAVNRAREDHLPVLLIDREIGTTLRRVYRNVPWWRRLGLLAGLGGSLLSREQIDEADLERLKEGDVLESTFSEFAAEQAELHEPLIAERDRYMALRLLQGLEEGHEQILAVVGAGHLEGIRRILEEELATEPPTDPAPVLAMLDEVPRPSRWPKLIPWAVVALVLVGFAVGFSRDHSLGWELVGDWVLINGGLSAAGAAIALAHPLTVVTAFVAAPLTSLNPTIGAGMVVAAVETWLRRPRVGDFARLRSDAAHPRGWWRNRVTRILMVFLLATLGSAVGTYLAGFRILTQLT
ncbi:MAG: TraB/GumN family protein [Pseudomonadota bacterium]